MKKKDVIKEYEKVVEKTVTAFNRMSGMGKLPEIVEYNKRLTPPDPDPKKTKILQGYETMTTTLYFLKQQLSMMIAAENSDFEEPMGWILSDMEDKLIKIQAFKEEWFDFTFRKKDEAKAA